jgi:hypothetical protein
LKREVDDVVLYQLMSLANNNTASTQARAIATLKIADLKGWLTSHKPTDEGQKAHFAFALSQIRMFEQDPKQLNLTRPADPPDGSPIGDDQDE